MEVLDRPIGIGIAVLLTPRSPFVVALAARGGGDATVDEGDTTGGVRLARARCLCVGCSRRSRACARGFRGSLTTATAVRRAARGARRAADANADVNHRPTEEKIDRDLARALEEGKRADEGVGALMAERRAAVRAG